MKTRRELGARLDGSAPFVLPYDALIHRRFPMATNVKLTFNKEKETKNAVRYQEAAKEGEEKVGTLYVKKSSFPDAAPAKLEVSITY
jgi:hypothetical protein